MSNDRPRGLFTFFEDLIDPFRPSSDDQPPTGIWPFYRHFLVQVWPIMLAMMVTGLVGALIEVSLFGFVGKIVDLAGSSPRDTIFAAHGLTLIGMAFIAIVIRPIFFCLHDLLLHQTVNPNLTALIRWQSHRYVLKQGLEFFHNDFAGRIANRVLATGDALRNSAVQIVDALWHVVIYAGSALFLFAEADWRLTLPLVCWIVCYIIVLAYFIPKVKARSVVASEARSKLMGRIVDGYTNIGTLKLFGDTRFEETYAREALNEQNRKFQHANRIITSMDVTIATLNGLLIAGTAGLALWLWSVSLLTLGGITLATGLVIRINNMSEWIMWVVNGIFDNVGTVQDGMKSISVPRSVVDGPGALPLAVVRGDIRFDDVNFHYGKRAGVLAGLNLHIRPGEKIGLIGPSGAGKSTLVNILLRLYDLESGRILIDDQDIARVTQDSLRAQIGVVSQDTSLLHRSIRENLLYGRPDATEEQVLRAVRQARADTFVPALSDAFDRHGLDAHVGERGVKLSGGQRQRIAIARVLLKDAPILVLDEATSALDSEVEAAIQESLETLMEGKTVIAIAHRLSTIARMDRLVVLDQGVVVESGTHAELIAGEGLYARLWHRQTGGFVAAQ
jgi:ATP-binding cassette subfamily B multidrug efflux pump